MLLRFSDREVPKANGLYIGLTKPQPLLRNFHEPFFGVTEIGGGSPETASPAWLTLQNPATERSEEAEARSISRTVSL
ncbi:MAG: hypothetical protein DMG76_29615 [Acidobacteria bacterium]|nr:MAG: hypothetical protein DMG76_29615 [Acidobacteriota bacterium]